jgi:hypothetical protein
MEQMNDRAITDAVLVNRMQLGDAYMPILAIKASLVPVRSEHDNIEKRPSGFTIALTLGGGGDSTFRCTVVRSNKKSNGDAAASDTYVLDGKTGASPAADTVCATLKDLIDALNEIEGITAFAAHAPHGLSLANNDFIASGTLNVRTDNRFLTCFYRDISESISDLKSVSNKVAYMRIGNPELRDSGYMRLLGISGSCTGVTATPTVRLVRDAYGKDVEFLVDKTLAAAQTAYIDNTKQNAESLRGPLLLEVGSSDMSVCDFTVKTMQGQW